MKAKASFDAFEFSLPVSYLALDFEKLLDAVIIFVSEQFGERVDGFLNGGPPCTEVDVFLREVGTVGVYGDDLGDIDGDLFDNVIQRVCRDSDGDVVEAVVAGVAVDHPAAAPRSARSPISSMVAMGSLDSTLMSALRTMMRFCGWKGDVDVLRRFGHLTSSSPLAAAVGAAAAAGAIIDLAS